MNYMKSCLWLMLVVSLPGPNKTVRMRLWRAIRGSGAVALRDGTYLLPARPDTRALADEQAAVVAAEGGDAWVLAFRSEAPAQDEALAALFDRGQEYAALLERIHAIRLGLEKTDPAELNRLLGGVRRDLTTLVAVDYFPGSARTQTEATLADLQGLLASRGHLDEPSSQSGSIERQELSRYQAKLWATRARPWVDRLASAWLIKRFIDPKARFRWIARPADCPKRAIGFDFDGARFTHVGARVTFEVLLASFGLEQNAALMKLGSMVHVLDVGGAQIAEAPGLAAILGGLKERILDDDELLAAVLPVFDALYVSFSAPQ